MKRLLIAGGLLAASCGVFAKGEMTPDDAVDLICGGIGEYSESVMRSRQLGENIANNIAVLNKNKDMAEPIKAHYREIIYEAYREPKWSTRENQDNAVTEFSNKMYMACATAFRKELNNLD